MFLLHKYVLSVFLSKKRNMSFLSQKTKGVSFSVYIYNYVLFSLFVKQNENLRFFFKKTR